jgi:hypothetical protein
MTTRRSYGRRSEPPSAPGVGLARAYDFRSSVVEARHHDTAIFAIGVRHHFELHHLRRRRGRGGLADGRRTARTAARPARLSHGDVELSHDHRARRFDGRGRRTQDPRRLWPCFFFLLKRQLLDSRGAHCSEEIGHQDFAQAINCRAKAFHQSGDYPIALLTSRALRVLMTRTPSCDDVLSIEVRAGHITLPRRALRSGEEV